MNQYRHSRQFVRVAIGLLTIALIIFTGSVSSGQTILTPRLQVPKVAVAPSPANPPSNASNVSTADVELDGRKLFTIAAPSVQPDQGNQGSGTPPIKERVAKIQDTLNQIISSNADPKTLVVKSTFDEQSRQPVISIGDRYLMTVTTLDAQLQGQDPEQRATDLVPIITDALAEARKERQPQYLMKQGSMAGQIALGMVIASGIVVLAQRRLKAQQQRLVASTTATEPDPDTAASANSAPVSAVQTQLKQRRRRNMNDIQRRLLNIVQLILWLGGTYVVLGLFPYTRWFQSLLLSGPLKIAGVILVAYFLIRVSDVIIDRFFSALTTNELISPNTSHRLALRVTTFSRVLRNVVATLWVSTALLSVLSIIGVQLGPVLAGAGILGLAISFASQNLIKDIINGLLILWEDQYAVGDVIQIGKASGLVEYMNLRITQLRNAEGRLITIPNSSITVVENLSKDWSRVDLGITIAYDADVDRALTVVKQVGEAMTSDPEWKNRIPESPDVLGVDEIGNEGITLRVWIKTLPLQQWNVAREFRRRLKRALDQEGIAIGLPQQSLLFRSPPDLHTVLSNSSDPAIDHKDKPPSHTDKTHDRA